MKTRKKLLSLLLIVSMVLSICFMPARAQGIKLDGNSLDTEVITDVTYSSIKTRPDGGKDYTFYVNGIENHYLVPPDGFDPLSATDAQLASYAFPPRPNLSDSSAYTEWVKLMSNYTGTPLPNIKVTSKPAPVTNTERSTQTKAVTGTVASENWSGYVADLGANNSNYFTQVQMDFTHPTISDIAGSSCNSYWVGLGGYNTSRLVQAGTASWNMYDHYAWYEYLSDDGITVSAQRIESLTINPGDSIHVYIAFQAANGLFEYYIANNTTGKSAAGTVNLPTATQFDGTTAEWVVERASFTTTSGLHTQYFLGNYGTVTLRNCKATKSTSNTWYTLGELNSVKVVMYGTDDNILSEPGNIVSSNRFTCTFRDYY